MEHFGTLFQSPESLQEKDFSGLLKLPMKVDGTEASPMKAVSQELDTLKVLLREALAAYTSRLEEDISQIQAKVNVPEKKVSSAKIRDLRDMLTLLRRSPIKPDKARRKDLKKIESLIEDLQMLSESWN